MNNPEIDQYGNQIWKDNQGRPYRDDDLPAYITTFGSKFWFFHYKIHRTFGPSNEFYNDTIEWYWLDVSIIDQ